MALHKEQSVYTFGAELAEAEAAVVLIHGRGASAASIMSLAREIPLDSTTYLAPQAAGSSWYPQSFLAPIKQNEPWLSSALELIGEVHRTITEAGIPDRRLTLAGFSQGACLACEYIRRNPADYGALLAFSGGVIGPPDTTFEPQGSLAGMCAFLGCSDQDPHIPKTRVEETARLLEAMDARVTTRIYPSSLHTIREEELSTARRILRDTYKSEGLDISSTS